MNLKQEITPVEDGGGKTERGAQGLRGNGTVLSEVVEILFFCFIIFKTVQMSYRLIHTFYKK